MTQEQLVPFRAGREEVSGQPGGALMAVQPSFTGPTVLLADVSEFQPNINYGTYLKWSKAVIIRCAYGNVHDDRAWNSGARRAAFHKGGAKFVGIYQYLVAGESGAAQADTMHRLVGAIQPGEVLVADFEEGQKGMLSGWYQRMLALGYPGPQLWTYSGLAFGQAQGVLPVEWLAAYRNTEPSSPHKLWQFTDSYNVPGIGTCDCSVFHGTIEQLAALAYQAAPPVTPPPSGNVPLNLSATVHPIVNLGWTYPDPQPDYFRYQVFKGKGADLGPNPSVPAVAMANVPGMNVQGVELPAPGQYTFRVQARNEPWSSYRDFTA